jgi:hypothetical protein
VTQGQLERAVAVATGETIRDVRSRGFSILENSPDSPDLDDLYLVIDCPFCGAVVPYPGLIGDDSPALAACPACDVEFEFVPHEVYAADMAAACP